MEYAIKVQCLSHTYVSTLINEDWIFPCLMTNGVPDNAISDYSGWYWHNEASDTKLICGPYETRQDAIDNERNTRPPEV